MSLVLHDEPLADNRRNVDPCYSTDTGILTLSERDRAQRDKPRASTADVQIRMPPLIQQRGYCPNEHEPSRRLKFIYAIPYSQTYWKCGQINLSKEKGSQAFILVEVA
ncbi:hypothetical protein llap_18003 [Limosa lapponica baueri]|uniref:Uncharacterized protein n=1 Tax=Limosa lapponica baueri TaxID=1758121 RepID=A0A2I0TD12_LIMLA|nr:hypothetical protein llap_18003 [Limosa lapponica baueri]